MNRRWLLKTGTAISALACATMLHAQYPGHMQPDEQKAATSTLRSVAVLEWTGDRSRPNATRLVPVSLFDGNSLQDGGLYLARPVPLALDSGTEYEVEASGLPQGWFDVDGAREIGQDWFGFGNWKPYLPPPPKKLHPSRNPPTVVRDNADADKPHFVRRDQSASPSGGSNTSPTGSAGSPASGKASTQASSAPVDPDRPRLRRRPEDANLPPQQAAAAPESPSSAPDPDRPRLSHGVPADVKNAPKELEITPVALGQSVAVSDADKAASQSFAYEWSSPADAANAQKQLEAQAEQLLSAAPQSSTPAKASSRTTARRTAPPTAAQKSAALKKKKQPLEPKSLLTDARFAAFALTNGSGATLVLTAHATGGTRSIAVIAQQDIYGRIVVLWHSITDDTHLDVTPRMTLIDAVDPRGDGRANLLFEQRNDNDRRFVLYVVGAETAEQVFATDPLPLHPVAAPQSD